MASRHAILHEGTFGSSRKLRVPADRRVPPHASNIQFNNQRGEEVRVYEEIKDKVYFGWGIRQIVLSSLLFLLAMVLLVRFERI